MDLGKVLVFDIETVPDVESCRAIENLGDLGDEEVAELMIHQRLAQTQGGSDFIRSYLHRIVAISVVFRGDHLDGGIKVRSLCDAGDPEELLVRGFFQLIDRHVPVLVSWNGCGFDLPVLHYRALLHGVSSRCYWEQGESRQDFRYNNYLNRYHLRHLDLMDILSGFQSRAVAPLQDIAVMLGLPGKLGMHGGEVWTQYRAGNIEGIRRYCEVDVINTYLVYLRWELSRGRLSPAQYANEQARLRVCLESQADSAPHFREFLDLWAGEAPAA
ncbi:3'-5' exonuclease [Thermithiobacillus plumbiphilus]|uniref:3'-5' exonuclease n=1 Tax=Thermithiobacillus plumbiphilus TaxID=1729899 RepID=A0ABU9D6U7_9PROT